MLIDDVVSYCDNEYRNHVCEHCSNEILCDHDCKKCLDDLHYHIIITEFAPIIVVNISWTITNVDIPTSIVLR